MDFRERKLSPEILKRIELFIRQRKLLYQPFIFTDDLEVGEGKNFHDGGVPPTGNVYWPNHPPEIADLIVQDRDYFRRCNEGYRRFYEHHMDECVRLLGGDISRRSFAEVGCNTGYSMLGMVFARRQARHRLRLHAQPGDRRVFQRYIGN